MTMEGQPSKPRPRWRAGLFIVGTIIGGLALGAALGFLAENKPFEQRSTARLVHDLRKADSPLDRLRQKLWPVLPDAITERLSQFTPMSADVIRQLAAVELRRRAPAGAEALPALVRALSDPHNGVRGMALQALAGFGPAAAVALPQVLPMLDMAGNPVLRSEAARTLMAIAPDEPRVRARFLSIARTRAVRADARAGNTSKANASQEALRNTVFRLMDKLARPDNEVVPLLLSELAQADAETAVEIIGALGRIGPVRAEIIPTLIQTLKEAQRPLDARWPRQHDDVAGAVLRAVQRLARADNDAVPLLIAALPEMDSSTAANILQTLGFIGPLTPQVIPAVVTALRSDNPRIQFSAITALKRMGPEAAPAVSDLVRLLEVQSAAIGKETSSSSPDERTILTVMELTPTGQPAVEPDWDEAMPPRMRMRPGRALSGSESMALQLVQCLAKIGPAARDAVPPLAKLMSETKSELRYEAGLAIWQIERTNVAAKTALIEGLHIPTPEFPRHLIRFFAKMDVDELPILNAALDHIDEEVRIAAFNAVSTLALEAEPAVLALERIADESANPLRARAMRTLEAIQLKTAQGFNAAKSSKQPLREPAKLGKIR